MILDSNRDAELLRSGNVGFHVFQELLQKERVSHPGGISAPPNKRKVENDLFKLVSEKIKILGAPDIGPEPVAAAKPVLAAFSKLAELRNFLLHTKWLAPYEGPSFRRPDDVVLGRNTGMGRRKRVATLYPALEVDQLERAVAACAEVESLVAFIVYGVARGKLPDDYLPRLISRAELIKRDIASLISSIKRN